MESKTGPEPETCPTHLIADQIATEDAFQHQAIANAIADMILNEQRGCAIALTGSWGSGKSTIVHLLEQELRSTSPDIATFVFDAWAHQGDPLRRTFLEKFIQWCNERPGKWTRDEQHWRGVLDELAKRKERIETTSSPRLTWWGAAGALSLLLAPVALQVYQKIQYRYHPWWDGVALVISTAPLIVGITLLIYWLTAERRKPEDRRKPLPSLLFTSTENNITSITSRTPDPTSVEFEKHYRNLLTDVLDGNQRRILLVVDNLDRVNHDYARSIWAALRVFFDPSVSNSSGWHTRVWVLVPFDPEAISDLWETDGSREPTNPSDLSHHFLEKTFQATFRVPPIILLCWKDYLLRQLRTAFPHHSDSEFHTIFRLYDRLRLYPNESITPRNLKVFVNRIGALHRQWQDKIPLTQQAAFALIADQPSGALLAALRSGGAVVPRPSIANTLSVFLGEGWQKNLAALYFNVGLDQAYQALLEQPIQSALQKGDRESIANLERSPGFAEVIEGIIEDPSLNSSLDPERLARMASAFVALARGWPGYDSCKAHLFRAAASVREWEPFDSDIGTGIADLLRIAPGHSDIRPIVCSVRDSLKFQATVPSSFHGANWCAGVAIALPALVERDEAAVNEDFHVKGDATQYLSVIAEAHQSGRFTRLWKYLKPLASKDEVLGFLVQKARGGGWDQQTSTILPSLMEVAPAWDWSVVVSGMQPRIEAPQQPFSADVPFILSSIFFLSARITKARTLLETLANNDVLLQHLHFLAQPGDWNIGAFCILPILTSDTSIQQPRHPQQQNTVQWRIEQGRRVLWDLAQNPNSNDSLLKILTSKFTRWLPLQRWRETAEKKPDRQRLIAAILKGHLQTDHGGEIEAADLIGNIDYWKGVAGAEPFESILMRKAASGELASALIARPFSVSYQHPYLLSLREGGSKEFKAFLKDGLLKCSPKDWDDALSGETELVEMALSLGGDGLTLGRVFQDTLNKHAERRLFDKSVGRLASSWGRLAALLEASERDVFDQRLWNKFESEQGRIAGLLPYYDPILLEIVEGKGPEKSFERIRQVIEMHDASEVNWLSGLVGHWHLENRISESIRTDWAGRAEASLQKDTPAGEKAALTALIGKLQSSGNPALIKERQQETI